MGLAEDDRRLTRRLRKLEGPVIYFFRSEMQFMFLPRSSQDDSQIVH